ncbi:MAG: hypothetical protein EA376_11240 [Phycisphaeraceae bacterium]|nr:MAG: hypothetical protein EA376_11240 [Phycisphaeraceae bacterium]
MLQSSVFAARTPYDGSEIRVEDARCGKRFLSVGFVFVMTAGGAVYGFAVSSKFFAAVALFVALFAALQLCLYLGAWLGERKGSKTNSTQVDFNDPAFSKAFRVRSTDHSIARAILTSPVRQRMLSTPGVSWWTVGHGWVSGVTRSEPVPLRQFGIPFRKGMSLQRIDETIDAVVQIASEIENEAG